MASGTKSPEHRSAGNATGRLAPIHVLLAEDDDLSRRAMVELLRYEGFRVEVAGNGMEALQRFRDQPHDQPIDVVVTDVHLPGHSGYELLQAIHGIRPDTAVIFASGMSREDSGIPDEILAQPRIAYLEKPIDIAALAAAIRALARR